MPITLTCSQGHTWELLADSPNGSAVPCPVCGEPVALPPVEGTLPLLRQTPQPPDAESATPLQPLKRTTDEYATLRHDSALKPAAKTVGCYEVPGFELLNEIGRGGMGVVWRARDLSLDREVAIKFLHEKFSADSSVAERFVEEARITGQLQHPGIPAVYHVGKLADGRPYLAMKLIKGQTLHELLAEKELPNWLAIFEAGCQAVGYAHARNVIDRDLKPANVMVGSFGQVQVMDWGLAKVLSSKAIPTTERIQTEPFSTDIRSPRASDSSDTQAGSVIGTPAFMSPEQAAGEVDRIDQRSDVFAIGAILCTILTGKPPYQGRTAEAVRAAAVLGKMDDALARLDGRGAEPGLVSLAKRCLAVEPNDRPADASAVAADVAGLRAAAEQRARDAEMERARAEVQATEQRKRRRAQLALMSVIAVLLLAGGAGIYVKYREATEALGQRDEAIGKRDDALK